MLKLISHIIVFIIFTLIVIFFLIAFITYPLWFWRIDTKKMEEGLEGLKERYVNEKS